MANDFVMKYFTFPIFRIFVLPNCQGLGPLLDVDQGKGRLLALHSFIHPGRWSLWGFIGIVIMDFRPTTLFITHRESWRSLRIHSISIPQVAFLPLSGHPTYHSIVVRRQEYSRCVVHPPTYHRPSYLPAFPRETSLASSLAWHCSWCVWTFN